MKIPTEITIGGMIVQVKQDNNLRDNMKALGKADYRKQIIWIDFEHQTEQSAEQTFIHEVFHFILHYLMLKERDDEKFVDNVAHLAYQVIKTAK